VGTLAARSDHEGAGPGGCGFITSTIASATARGLIPENATPTRILAFSANLSLFHWVKSYWHSRTAYNPTAFFDLGGESAFRERGVPQIVSRNTREEKIAAHEIDELLCGIGFCGVPRPSLADYVRVLQAREGLRFTFIKKWKSSSFVSVSGPPRPAPALLTSA